MIHRRKIKDTSDAIFAIKLIIKIYKQTIPNNSDVKILTEYYEDAINRIQKKFRGSDLSLFKLSEEWKSNKFQNIDHFEKFNVELISKCEALRDFVESKIGIEYSENKTIEQRIGTLEKSFKKFDEQLNYALNELATLKNKKKEQNDHTTVNNKIKLKKSMK